MFAGAWIASAVNPEIPEDWLLENLVVLLLIGSLAASYRWLTLSDWSYLLIFALLCLHECGAHYQYSAAVPGQWIKAVFRTERNDYDRAVHFLFGLFFTYPQREVLMRKAHLRGAWLNVLPVLTTLALSAMYEMIEALTAAIVDPINGAAFLGSQGDPWDSQEDMAMALVGATISMIFVVILGRRRRGNNNVSPGIQ